MSLKVRLRVAIVTLIALVVITLSALYSYDYTTMQVQVTEARAHLAAAHVQYYVLERIEQVVASQNGRPESLDAWKVVWTNIVRKDPAIQKILRNTLGQAETASSIDITDENGITLASSDPAQVGSSMPALQDFRTLEGDYAFRTLRNLFTDDTSYALRLPLGVGQHELFNIIVVIPSRLLRDVMRVQLEKLGIAFVSSLCVAVFLAFLLPNFVLSPLERVGRSIDRIRSGKSPAAPRERAESPEFADVQAKLNLLGQQFEGARQDALDLRSNIEQLVERLEDATLFFDPGGRLMLAGSAAQTLLGKTREQLAGHQLEDIFPRASVLGHLLLRAAERRTPVRDQAVVLEGNGAEKRRVLVNLEILSGPDENDIGTLVTLRDAESRRQLESQLDLAARLAAISGLMGGVAHEIKNPLNAIALNVEVLRNKIGTEQPEIDVIAREIARLDRVVRTFLSFNRPVEVNSRPLNVTEILRDVIELIAHDAGAKNIAVQAGLDRPAWTNGDPALLTQAMLNVVTNALEAMHDGGTLTAHTRSSGGECIITIADDGCGIPEEVKDKIFNLYFTTKEQGAGIGLAFTFRIVQLHSGDIDFESEPGKGTTFWLKFPSMPSAGAGREDERLAS